MFDNNRYVMKEYDIISDRIKKTATFIFLSDLHNKDYGNHNARLVADIQKINPDGIMIGGDMLTAREHEDAQNAIDFISLIAREFPVYYAFGNHESRMKNYPELYQKKYDFFLSSLKNAGVHFLLNERLLLPDTNIELCGLEVSGRYYKKTSKTPMKSDYIESLIGPVKKDNTVFTLVMAHNPEYFEQYAKWGADLVLSGHIHGGMIRFGKLGGFISPSFRFFPHYDGGEYKEYNATMVISRGLGVHTIPLRICNPGELIVLKLHN